MDSVWFWGSVFLELSYQAFFLTLTTLRWLVPALPAWLNVLSSEILGIKVSHFICLCTKS
jgi:hypothetical protein